MAFEEATPAGTATTLHLQRYGDEVMYIVTGKAFEETVRLQRPTTASMTIDDPFRPLGDAELLHCHGWELVGPALVLNQRPRD
jgi:hypothetical protein